MESAQVAAQHRTSGKSCDDLTAQRLSDQEAHQVSQSVQLPKVECHPDMASHLEEKSV